MNPQPLHHEIVCAFDIQLHSLLRARDLGKTGLNRRGQLITAVVGKAAAEHSGQEVTLKAHRPLCPRVLMVPRERKESQDPTTCRKAW